jgi:hypothetical protein
MKSSAEHDATEREFDLIMARSGIVVPEAFRAGTLASYQDLRRLASLLRSPRAA